jgi:hypothetical protein
MLFTDAMVRAILEGRKTQTRRMAKPQSYDAESKIKVGDLIWVRECWSYKNLWRPGPEGYGATVYRADSDFREAPQPYGKYRWIPSIHMPRDRSRLTLRVLSVEVYPVCFISEDDARAEGYDGSMDGQGFDGRAARAWFEGLWDSIYGQYTYMRGRLCFAYKFEVVK